MFTISVTFSVATCAKMQRQVELLGTLQDSLVCQLHDLGEQSQYHHLLFESEIASCAINVEISS